MPSSRRLALLIVALVALDQLTKSWAVSALDDGHTIDIVWTLRFALGFNSGIAFSQAQGLGPVVGVIAVVAVVLLYRYMRKATHPLMAYGLAGILAGAVGNIADRLFRGKGLLHGKVVDFIDFQWFPIFNVADSCITIGAIVLIISLYLEQSKLRKNTEAA
ncbi:MAG: signal peptidase II [Ilumatobacteraceae bacterium]